MGGGAAFIDDRQQPAFALALLGNRHRNANGGAVLFINPRVVRDCKRKADPVLGVQVPRHDRRLNSCVMELVVTKPNCRVRPLRTAVAALSPSA